MDYVKATQKIIFEAKQPYCYNCHYETKDYAQYWFKFCCEGLKAALHECRIPLVYDEKRNQFVLFHKNDLGFDVLLYCPWCGTELKLLLNS